MNSVKEEWFAFLSLASNDLYLALRSIAFVKNGVEPYVQVAMARDAAISYSRPFTRSKNYFHNKINKGLRLPDEFVEAEHRDLHALLLRSRDVALAHTDLSARNPSIYFVGSENPLMILSTKGVGHEMLHVRAAKMGALFESVQKRIEAESARLKEELVLTHTTQTQGI